MHIPPQVFRLGRGWAMSDFSSCTCKRAPPAARLPTGNPHGTNCHSANEGVGATPKIFLGIPTAGRGTLIASATARLEPQ
jgi:hypothetical protein